MCIGYSCPKTRGFRFGVGPGHEFYKRKALLYTGSTNSSPRATSGPLPASINKVLLEYKHAHSLAGLQSQKIIYPDSVPTLAPQQVMWNNLVMKSGSIENKPKWNILLLKALLPLPSQKKEFCFQKLQGGSCVLAEPMDYARSQSSVIPE